VFNWEFNNSAHFPQCSNSVKKFRGAVGSCLRAAGPISTPHFLFFSAEKKRKRAVDGPKEKKTLISLVENFRLVERITRSPSLI
jgi:hypothetical protein